MADVAGVLPVHVAAIATVDCSAAADRARRLGAEIKRNIGVRGLRTEQICRACRSPALLGAAAFVHAHGFASVKVNSCKRDATRVPIEAPLGQIRSIALSRSFAAVTTFCTAPSTCSPVSVAVAERNTSVMVTLLVPFSSGLPR